MLKECLFILVCFAHSLFPMENCPFILPSQAAPLLLQIAALDHVDEMAIAYYAQLIVDPAKIRIVKKKECLPPTQRFRAELNDGNIVDCTYFPYGRYTSEIWATCTFLHNRIKFKLPIDPRNFFILKAHYESKSTNHD